MFVSTLFCRAELLFDLERHFVDKDDNNVIPSAKLVLIIMVM